MIRIIKFASNVVWLFLSAVIYVNANPVGYEMFIESFMIFSGVIALRCNSFIKIIIFPVVGGIFMSAFGDLGLLYNEFFCVSFAFMIYLLKNREWIYKLIYVFLVFILKAVGYNDYYIFGAVINSLIFFAICLFFTFSDKKHSNDIFEKGVFIG